MASSEPDLSHSSSNQHQINSPINNTSPNSTSKDGSFSSVTSSSATYHTAREEVNSSSRSLTSSNNTSSYMTPAGSGDLRPQFYIAKKEEPITRRRESNSSTCTTTGTESNSGTLEEGESYHSGGSLSNMGELFEEEADKDGVIVGEEISRLSLSSSPSENAIEVREDISRICNTIAESEGLDRVKKREIEEALRLGDLKALGKLATTGGGLLSNALRTRAWPLLLKVSSTDISRNECKKIPTFFPDVPEKISSLVNLDVARVLKRFPPGLTDPQQDHLQSYLNNLICSVLQEKRKAYYYQGFHDISLTMLLVSISQNAPYLAYLCLNRMIESNLSPYMEKTMDRTHDVIHVLFAILEAEDPTLYKKIVIGCECPVAFCLPWVLTWFSHTLPSDTDVFRLYDFMLGSQEQLSEPFLIPIFVSAMLILRNSKLVKEDDDLTDIASMHHRLTKLSSELETLEPWLADSVKLMKKYQGQEEKLLRRGVQIKALQNRLWNEENKPIRRPPPSPGVISSVSKFLFVQHRWATVSLVILGAAVILQSKYGRSMYKLSTFKSIVQGYTPNRFQNILKYWLIDESNDE